MTKQELVACVGRETGISQANVKKVIDATFGAIGDALVQNDSYTYAGFGSWHVVTRNARMQRNIATGQMEEIPERKAVKFKVSSLLRDRVNV